MFDYNCYNNYFLTSVILLYTLIINMVFSIDIIIIYNVYIYGKI